MAFSKKTILEVLSSIWINLSSAWFGVLLVTPGFISTKNISQYLSLLTTNLPLGILSLMVSFYLTEAKNKI